MTGAHPVTVAPLVRRYTNLISEGAGKLIDSLLIASKHSCLLSKYIEHGIEACVSSSVSLIRKIHKVCIQPGSQVLCNAKFQLLVGVIYTFIERNLINLVFCTETSLEFTICS